mmetsp:Transcript_94044/g.244949  ORF Transcript_94044/g.244949 Transcript_94044/m.244949 type:complete len:201 (+) Transcript_94044:103-705(+)
MHVGHASCKAESGRIACSSRWSAAPRRGEQAQGHTISSNIGCHGRPGLECSQERHACRPCEARLEKRCQVDIWKIGVVVRDGAADIGQQRWAPHATEPHVRVVGGVGAVRHVLVPGEPPLASRLQLGGLELAARDVAAAAVASAAVEIVHGDARELPGATAVEQALASSRNLDVERVLARHVVADVVDLHDHRLPHQRGM